MFQSAESAKNADDELSRLDPQMTVVVEDKSIGLLGYVVIDRTVNDRSCGGLRLMADVTVHELKGLARAMTLKYGFSGMAQGGAKAGIVADPFGDPAHKEKLIRRFGQIIAPLLRSQYYISGTDMNTVQSDISNMMAAAGVEVPRRRRTKGKKSGFFTAVSVMIAAEVCCAYTQTDFSKCRVAIEGFGAVGGSLAGLLAKRKKCKIVAVSSSEGALYDPAGLDINKLLALKEQHGSRFIHHCDQGSVLERGRLLTLQVDILFPCGRHHSIRADNVQQVPAPIICPGANIPISAEAEMALAKKGCLSIPYFISNCGGVIGNKMEILGATDRTIESLIRKKNSSRIQDLIRLWKKTGEPMNQIAERYATQRFNQIRAGVETKGHQNRLRKMSVRLLNQGLIPEGLTRPLAPVFFRQTMLKDPPIR